MTIWENKHFRIYRQDNNWMAYYKHADRDVKRTMKEILNSLQWDGTDCDITDRNNRVIYIITRYGEDGE